MPTPRRTFITNLTAGLAILSTSHSLSAEPKSPDDPWLDYLSTKKQKAFIDVGHFFVDSSALRRTGFMLTALHDHYGADSTAIGAVFGAHGSGYGHLMSQAAWDEFKIIDLVAPQLLPDDVATLRMPGKKWGTTSAESVTALQSRGVRFLACDNTLAKWSRIIATERGLGVDSISKQLVAGLLPGVERVPAMSASAIVAQARGVGYVAMT